jgi:predicted phage terminase large subunit-like protein
MTRWHEDDLAGWLLEEAKRGGEKWDVVDFPAIADDGDILGRKQGEYLWEERFSPSEYEDTKKAIGSKLWTALYQQKPSPDSGAVFKRYWWKFYLRHAGQMTHETRDCVILPERLDEEIQSWDCTFKDAATSDFVVGEVWGTKSANRYLLDMVRDRMDLPDTIKAIKNLSAKWPRARRKLIEDKANGPAVIQMLHNQLSGLIAVNPEGGKIVRAMAVTPEIESGNVYLPHPSIAPWVLDFIEEASVFPNGKNDDMVDGMTQGLADLQKNRRFNLVALIS